TIVGEWYSSLYTSPKKGLNPSCSLLRMEQNAPCGAPLVLPSIRESALSKLEISVVHACSYIDGIGRILRGHPVTDSNGVLGDKSFLSLKPANRTGATNWASLP